jgi:hypothetical protein
MWCHLRHFGGRFFSGLVKCPAAHRTPHVNYNVFGLWRLIVLNSLGRISPLIYSTHHHVAPIIGMSTRI